MAVTETIQELLQGIDSAQYGRDMRQYIHKGIQKCYEEGSAGETDLEARTDIGKIQNNLGTIETTTASKSYLIGETVIIDGVLYNVTSAVAQGGTFVPGTNIIESGVMLNALPQAIKIPLPDLVGIGGLYNNSFCYKVGATVCVVIDIDLTQGGRYFENALRLPNGYRPNFTIRHGVKSFDHPSYTSEYVEIKSDGYINLQTYVSESYGSAQYKSPLSYVCRFDVFAS